MTGPFMIDDRSLGQFVKEMAGAPRAVRDAVRRAMWSGADKVRATAAADVSTWSTRIPGTLRVRYSLSRDGAPSASIAAGSTRRGSAPHARAYEGLLQDVFGPASIPTRPFLLDALEREHPRLLEDVQMAAVRALRAAAHGD